jgi:hypothetical protein
MSNVNKMMDVILKVITYIDVYTRDVMYIRCYNTLFVLSVFP